METNTRTRTFHPLEIWWWERQSYTRWFVGSIALATMAGVMGGLFA